MRQPRLAFVTAIGLALIAGSATLAGCSSDNGATNNPANNPSQALCGGNTLLKGGACDCVPGWSDCNSDIGKSGGNGCECGAECNGPVCGTGSETCSPNTLNVCGDSALYCDGTQCTQCPPGKYNCDGFSDCEADKVCGSDGCEQYGAKTCGSQTLFCDNGACKTCEQGKYNCDMAGGDCECGNACSGGSCKASCTSQVGCGDTATYCDYPTCESCPVGRLNCDGKGACECEGTCNGTDCVGTRLCDYFDTTACGTDNQWCYQNECIFCSDLNKDGRPDYYNCNGTKGCECDDAGCNGTQCAGKCYGGECP